MTPGGVALVTPEVLVDEVAADCRTEWTMDEDPCLADDTGLRVDVVVACAEVTE